MTPLRQRMIADMQIRNLPARTQEAYAERVAEFARFHGRSPSRLHIDHVRSFLAHLVNDKRVSRSYLRQSVADLRFLRGFTLGRSELAERIPFPRRSRSLLTVLTRAEIVRLLDATVSLKQRAILMVCYSAASVSPTPLICTWTTSTGTRWPDSRTAYVVDTRGQVFALDLDTMQQVGPAMAYTPVKINQSWRLRQTFASVSPDGRYLVINTGGRDINVLDLVNHRTYLVDTPGIATTYDLEFNYAQTQDSLLAIHGQRGVAVYRFHGAAELEPLALTALPGQQYNNGFLSFPGEQRIDTLAWTGRGDGVIAAIAGAQEFRILDWLPGPPSSLRTRLDFDSCNWIYPEYYGLQVDVVTVNKPHPPTPPTSTPTDTPSATPTLPPPTPSASSPATASATLSSTLTSTPTPKATPTMPPRPLYLPVALRESCTPGQRRVDVALVIDASTTMRDDRTAAGRTKLDAAIEAATFFVGAMSLPLDQAAVVVFNETGTVVQPLSGRRADIEAALAWIPRLVRQQTRIDLGIEKAHGELTSTRRNPANDPVLILLTDGLANPVPASVAVQRAGEAKADHITIFTIGLGQATALNVLELAQMASRPAYFYLAPDGEDLQGIYRTIAVEIPCPPSHYWGGR
jgi:Mg-chelatase subunit ChlD